MARPPRPCGAVLEGHAVGRTVGAGGHAAGQAGGVVAHPPAHRYGCERRGAPAVMALAHVDISPMNAERVDIPRTLLTRVAETLPEAA